MPREAVRLAGDATGQPDHAARRRRSAGFLRNPARADGASAADASHPRALARAARSTLIGLGYSTPYLGAFRGEAQRLGALMPDSQGAVRWPRDGASQASWSTTTGCRSPTAPSTGCSPCTASRWPSSTRQLLREMWRVLAPEGRMILVVPNRRGVWARLDNTPFGQGRPYSRRQLEELLVGAMFTPLDWGGALFFPPLGRQMLLRSATAWERLGAGVSPAFCGVLIVEASKELMAPIGRPAKARRLRQLVTSATPARRDRA